MQIFSFKINPKGLFFWGSLIGLYSWLFIYWTQESFRLANNTNLISSSFSIYSYGLIFSSLVLTPLLEEFFYRGIFASKKLLRQTSAILVVMNIFNLLGIITMATTRVAGSSYVSYFSSLIHTKIIENFRIENLNAEVYTLSLAGLIYFFYFLLIGLLFLFIRTSFLRKMSLEGWSSKFIQVLSTVSFILIHFGGYFYREPWLDQLQYISYYTLIGLVLFQMAKRYGLKTSIATHIHINTTVYLFTVFFVGLRPVDGVVSFGVLALYVLLSAYLVKVLRKRKHLH